MLEKLNTELKHKLTELQNGYDDFKQKYLLCKSMNFHKNK
jgi:septation ring formation regulator EzrA